MLLILLLLFILFLFAGAAVTPLLWFLALICLVAYVVQGPRSGRWR